MVIVSLFVTAGSVELLFFLRYQAILPASHSNKLTTVFSVIIILIWQIFLITLMLLMFKLAIPDQKTARAQFIELYPDLQYLVASKHVFIVCVVVETIHVIFLCLCVFRIGIGGTIAIVLIWMSSRALKSVQLSPTTRRIHLQLIRSLCYQVSGSVTICKAFLQRLPVSDSCANFSILHTYHKFGCSFDIYYSQLAK